MNERIRELAGQAGMYDFVLEAMGIGEEFEKFAELIVRECADIADEYDGVGSTIVSRIKKHFGVEE
jgi:hypothetical protein